VEAVRAGAAHAYAIEQLPEIAERARAVVSRAGLSDRVTVITGHSCEVSLPQRANLCISEVLGNIAGAEGAAAVIRDAHRRLCRPGAAFIPDRAATAVAAVSLGADPCSGSLAIASAATPFLADVFASVGHPFDIRLCIAGNPLELIISRECEIEHLDFRSGTFPSQLGGVLKIAEPALLHGFLLWTRLWVAPDSGLLDTLRTPEPSWAPVYAPVSVTGVEVASGDAVAVSFTATESDDAVHPDYGLRARIVRRSACVKKARWISPHHAPRFRRTPAYRSLFPEPSSGERS
jgi:protein arginine N-methyltransferase 1